MDKVVTTIRCDNAGENQKLESSCTGKDWKLPIKFEYTARATPEQNSLVEKKFDTLASRARSVMNASKVPDSLHGLLVNEYIQTITLLDGLVVREIDGVKATRFEHWGKELPKFNVYLREWGEAGIVCTRDIKTSKLSNKGVLCMFVGYALQHAGDCYRMYNPKTKKIMISRDIKWMNEMFYNIQNDTQKTKVTDTSHDIDSLNDDDLSIPDIQKRIVHKISAWDPSCLVNLIVDQCSTKNSSR